MPIYTFMDKNTNEVFDKMMSWESRCKYLEENDNLTQVIGASGLIAGRSMDSGRLPEGFKDKLRLMKQKHPKARGVDHLI